MTFSVFPRYFGSPDYAVNRIQIGFISSKIFDNIQTSRRILQIKILQKYKWNSEAKMDLKVKV